MLVKEVALVADNDSSDIEFRKIDVIKGNVIYTSIKYELCRDTEVIGILAKDNKLIITV